MKIALIIIGIIIILVAIAGVICYYTLLIPNRKHLTEEERKICEKLVKQGKGYPFVCRQAVKLGKCPCLPCKKLEQVKLTISIKRKDQILKKE